VGEEGGSECELELSARGKEGETYEIEVDVKPSGTEREIVINQPQAFYTRETCRRPVSRFHLLDLSS